MCYPVPCETCGKTTWAGCGQHVDGVKAQVPAAQWCAGHEDAAAPRPGGFLSRLLRR
ncbi:hypothetical protein Xcel_1971 [Xylanimonas cellulosilytica DSM 15894]|uniref:Uncharacterized protein n=1 Tax=Xylanimonas cellulosilytica (strain DSM 15894 / JCM 12276 / CECT 5975 / KCTC 9989 / LMG 20990 / NBRC 107835 / XIL07) TaxID=446471 RepID=D1BTL1_XYLCX|nr:hypothetical protein [Xylanimonas cellulosilytica]ACZ30990.1 hypothetical protein Xcel_1971 [Xylanimonas cellulosilytica DSM 15894]